MKIEIKNMIYNDFYELRLMVFDSLFSAKGAGGNKFIPYYQRCNDFVEFM